MKEILIIISAILVLIIVYLLYRLMTILKIARGKQQPDKEAHDRSNSVNAVLMIVFLVIGMLVMVWSVIDASDDFLPEPASSHGEIIDRMIYITFLITGFVFVITQVLLFYFAFKYRHKKNRKAYYFPINYRLEIIWTAIPAITFIGLFILGYRATKIILSPADPEAQHIEIMGQQFSWMVRYPGEDQELGDFDFRLVDTENNMGINFADKASLDDFIPMQMVLPVNTPVELKIRSRDVIHSVFLPHFRVKMDAVPGMPTRFKFTPTITTEEMREKLDDPDFDYELACTELCGRGHFSMKMMVKVIEQDEFADWYAAQDPWLAKHPEYLAKVPKALKQTAYAIINKDSILTSKVK